MSTPLSRSPESKSDLESSADRPQAPGESSEAEASTPALEELDLTPGDASETEEADSSSSSAPQDLPSRTSRTARGLSFVLLVLLLVSLGGNWLQWRDRARVHAQAGEFQVALESAVEKLDAQTARTLAAEETLGDVDMAMDTVRERLAGLQEALDELEIVTQH